MYVKPQVALKKILIFLLM